MRTGPRPALPKILALTVLFGLVAGSAEASDWLSWRGPEQNGRAAAGTYPVQWDPHQVLWRVAVPGEGVSTPIVRQGCIYLTSGVDGSDTVLAYDLSGRELWRRPVGPETPGRHSNGTGSNPSAVADDAGLFVFFKSGHLAALEWDGRIRWQTNLFERYGKDRRYWDFGTSPVLTRADVVVAEMHDGDSWVVALDKASGAVHWKAARNFETALEGRQGYTTPLVFSHAGQEALLIWGGHHLTAQRATDGATLWTCGGFNPEGTKNWPSVATPVIAGDTVIVPCGRADRRQPRLHGIRLGGRGDVTATHRLWRRTDLGPFIPCPATQGGRVYVVQDQGAVACIDPATGTSHWQGELPEGRGKVYTSPLLAGGHLYLARESGVFYVLGCGERFEVVATIDMGERIIASPIAVDGRLLIRTRRHLVCVGSGGVAR